MHWEKKIHSLQFIASNIYINENYHRWINSPLTNLGKEQNKSKENKSKKEITKIKPGINEVQNRKKIQHLLLIKKKIENKIGTDGYLFQ